MNAYVIERAGEVVGVVRAPDYGVADWFAGSLPAGPGEAVVVYRVRDFGEVGAGWAPPAGEELT